METETGELKDCPSCGSRIAESAVKCSFCKSGLGHCLGCNAWIVEGTECLDCGKSTAVRVRKAAKAAASQKEPPKYHFDASALGLILPLVIRLALAAGCVAAIALAVAASPLDPATRLLIDHGVRPPKLGWPLLWGAAGGLLLAVGFAGTFVRRFRMSHTLILGQPVEVTTSIGSIILDLLITAIVLALTAGLGLPWLYARYRRSFYRGCSVKGRGEATLDFQGAGEEVLGRFCLTVLLLPIAIGTGGFLLGIISWMWLKWDQSNLLVPDKYGQKRPVRFTGTFGGYLGRWMLGWLLTLVSAGLYRPWAKLAEWRWVAQQTQVV